MRTLLFWSYSNDTDPHQKAEIRRRIPQMIQETPEMDKLRLTALQTSDEDEFKFCRNAYRRKGGIHALAFVKARKIKFTYKKILRKRKGIVIETYYCNQLCNEFVEDCCVLRACGMDFGDIAIALGKNYGLTKESSVKYACSLGRIATELFKK